MNAFNYYKFQGLTALSASITDFRYKKHSHHEYAVGLTLNGVQAYNLEGTSMSSHKNGVVLFNSEQPHDGMAGGHSTLNYIMLYIDPSNFSEILEKKERIKFETPILYNRELAVRISKLHQIIVTHKEDDLLFNEMLMGLVHKLMEFEPNIKYDNEHARIKKAKEILIANRSKPLKLEEICKELQLSKYQFIRIFSSHTGISPYQYFLNCKVEYAKKIIEETRDIYVAVIECDFVDLTHLNKHFKRVYGITAYEYCTQLN